jgi:hypothetical protein
VSDNDELAPSSYVCGRQTPRLRLQPVTGRPYSTDCEVVYAAWPAVQVSVMLQRRKTPKLLTLLLAMVAIIAMMRTFRSCAQDLEQHGTTYISSTPR